MFGQDQKDQYRFFSRAFFPKLPEAGFLTIPTIFLAKCFKLFYNSKAKQAGDRPVFRKKDGEESPNTQSRKGLKAEGNTLHP